MARTLTFMELQQARITGFNDGLASRLLISALSRSVNLTKNLDSSTNQRFMVGQVKRTRKRKRRLTLNLHFMAGTSRLRLTLRTLTSTSCRIIRRDANNADRNTDLLITIAHDGARLATILSRFSQEVSLRLRDAFNTLSKRLLADRFSFGTNERLSKILDGTERTSSP